MVIASDHRRLLLDAARATIRDVLRGKAVHSEADFPPCPDPALLVHAGCFVSLHELRNHHLRGCVGRMDATRPLWESVHHAATGVLEDPRFHDERVRLDELPMLEIEISVLSPMHPAPNPLEFNPETDGIYLTIGNRSGCFLPQVAQETGWNREQLLSRLCIEKMGLSPYAWQEPGAKLMVFTTLIIGPEPFGDV